jgi:hypothetical protein
MRTKIPEDSDPNQLSVTESRETWNTLFPISCLSADPEYETGVVTTVDDA